jgi:hypothetical protein
MLAGAGQPAQTWDALPPPNPDARQFYMGPVPRPKKSPVVGIFIGVIIFALVLLVGGVMTMFVHAAQVRASKAPISNGSLRENGETVVTSRGITITLPKRYENIPTTAEKLQKFFDEQAKTKPSIREFVKPSFVSHLAILAMRFDDAGDVISTFQVEPTRDPSDVQGLLRQVPRMIGHLRGRHAQWGTTHIAGREVAEVWFSRQPDDLNADTTYQHMIFVPTSRGAIVLDVTAPSELMAANDMHDIATTLQVP